MIITIKITSHRSNFRMGTCRSKEPKVPEIFDSLFQRIKQRLKEVPPRGDNLRDYPYAPHKPWVELATTWDKLADPVEYTKLLLETIKVHLPDGTVLFTIEYLCDKDLDFWGQVILNLGLDRLLPAEFHLFIDLLWTFYLTGNSFIMDSEARSYISGLEVDALFLLVNHTEEKEGKRFPEFSPNDRSALMFTALTGTVFFEPGRADTSFTSVGLNKKTGLLYPPNGILRIKRTFTERYGKSIFRVLLYAQGKLENLGPIITLQMAFPFDILEGNIYQTSHLFFFILAYHRDFSSHKLLEETLPLPTVLTNLIFEYAHGDDVSILSEGLGMVFPSYVNTPGKQTNYFWATLHQYEALVQRYVNLGYFSKSERWCIGEKAFLTVVASLMKLMVNPQDRTADLPDKFFLDHAMKPITDWIDRNDLIRQYKAGEVVF